MPVDLPGTANRQAVLYDDRWKFFFIRLAMKFGMKNPYEEKKPELSPEFLKDKAGEMRAIRGKCDKYLMLVRYLIGDLEALWHNDIQSSLTAELGSMQNSLVDYSELIEEFAGFLEYAARELNKDPAAVKKFAEWNEKNEEPVQVVLPDIPKIKLTRDDLPAETTFGIPGKISFEPDKSLVAVLERLLKKIGLGSRGEDSRTQLLIQRMKYSALEMRSAMSQYSFNVRKMKYTVEDLVKLWQNDTQSELIEELEQMESAIKDFSNIADEYATLLDMAVQELETKKVGLDQASVLSEGKDGPLDIALSNIPYLKRGRIDLKAFDPYFERTQVGVSTVVTASRKNAEYIYNVYEDHIELVKYIGMHRSVQIPSELDGLPVTHLGLDCFAMAWRVRFVSITLPESVTTIYHGAFRGCSYIREIKLPRGLKYIGNYAFAFISDLEHISIPEGVVSFGMGAFRNCDHLKEIVIPDSTLRIGNDCFYSCRNLQRAVIGSGVIDVDDWAFRMCEHLSSVTIGENVKKIGESAFYDDVLLMRLDIPENVEKIGENAFYHRRNMTLGVVPGSAGERFVRENNLKYVTV